MTYSTATPPILITPAPVGGDSTIGGRIWVYLSTDSPEAIDNDGYITNGVALGMRIGDRVHAADTNASPPTYTDHWVTELNTDGSVNLSNASVSGGSGTIGD